MEASLSKIMPRGITSDCDCRGTDVLSGDSSFMPSSSIIAPGGYEDPVEGVLACQTEVILRGEFTPSSSLRDTVPGGCKSAIVSTVIVLASTEGRDAPPPPPTTTRTTSSLSLPVDSSFKTSIVTWRIDPPGCCTSPSNSEYVLPPRLRSSEFSRNATMLFPPRTDTPSIEVLPPPPRRTDPPSTTAYSPETSLLPPRRDPPSAD
mmetsp:Transcript_9494/g.15519  ORF Transcript_9494/g.15519 Transcript_9494/m.15519 type:complete len:205 (+) Transcript_9494:161-775(+)